MKGCNCCPAFAKCTEAYRGSGCAALRSSYGIDSDPEIKTNGNKIRVMTDEELAKWLLEVMMHQGACFGEGAFPYSPCRNMEGDCVACGVAWLQQQCEEAKDDGSLY